VTRLDPIVLGANQPPDRFYAGGDRIAAFRGHPTAGDHVPEDWIASTTSLFGDPSVGRTRLPDGRMLDDVVRADPVRWLGPAHAARFGADAGLLVKLLDAGQRLPVHAHPDRSFARRHLGLGHGKTEAWIVLEPGTVHLGLARDVGERELAGWVEAQDAAAMLGAMHRLDVACGDAVLVPAGMPHAIGAGTFVLELQEPTDLSILLEWTGFDLDGPRDGHLDLGFDIALGAIDRRGRERSEIAGLVRATSATVGDLLPGAGEFFRAERWRAPGRWDAGFAVVAVVDGAGVLAGAGGPPIPLRRGTTVVVPHAAGELDLTVPDGIELVRCRPPSAG
jgi:mannose-6-phosphate isomerase